MMRLVDSTLTFILRLFGVQEKDSSRPIAWGFGWWCNHTYIYLVFQTSDNLIFQDKILENNDKLQWSYILVSSDLRVHFGVFEV